MFLLWLRQLMSWIGAVVMALLCWRGRSPPTSLGYPSAATAAGRPSAFLLNTYRRRCHLRMAEAGAPALAHNEPITTVPDGRAPSDASRSHRGSGLTSAASAHHPQVTEATTPTLAPSEPITTVSDGRPLSTAGTSHQGADPAPTADPPHVAEATAPTLAPSEPITTVSDGRPLSTAGTSHQGAGPAPTADPIEEPVLAAARPPDSSRKVLGDPQLVSESSCGVSIATDARR